jgi:hypothetical protein
MFGTIVPVAVGVGGVPVTVDVGVPGEPVTVGVDVDGVTVPVTVGVVVSVVSVSVRVAVGVTVLVVSVIGGVSVKVGVDVWVSVIWSGMTSRFPWVEEAAGSEFWEFWRTGSRWGWALKPEAAFEIVQVISNNTNRTAAPTIRKMTCRVWMLELLVIL